MRLLYFHIAAILFLLTTSTSLAQYEFNRWTPEDGCAVRQGWHVEWFRASASHIEGQSAGEVAFAWSDCRSGDRGVYMQVIRTDGRFKFDRDGLLIADRERQQEDPFVHPCSDGGWFVAWEDFHDDTLGNIHCTRISSRGEHLLGDDETGIEVCTIPNSTQESIHIVEDEDGGCIIAWKDKRRDDTGDIFAMHVTSNGELDPDWTENGNVIVAEMGYQGQHSSTSDGEGGMIICWRDGRGDDDWNIWAQRITPGGELLWGEGEGIIVCNDDSEQEVPRICRDGQGGAFICWKDGRNYRETNYDIYAQRIDSDGQLLWGEDGAAVCNVEEEQSYNRIVPAGEGQAIVCWQNRQEDDLTYDIFAMKISGEEELVREWEPEDGVPVVIEEGNQWQVRLCPDGEGGAYFVWEDERNDRTVAQLLPAKKAGEHSVGWSCRAFAWRNWRIWSSFCTDPRFWRAGLARRRERKACDN